MHRIYFDGRWIDIADESSYKAFLLGFREVEAAGGLVTNPEGKYLMIHRNGLWDLPKGHREEGEDIETTAVREVTEETGVRDLITCGLICVTDHCYFRNGVWNLKHTWWYRMKTADLHALVPQTEEGINVAEWVRPSELEDHLENTYPSIREVFSTK